ncbi:cupin domain-containing protein [Pantoea ananatis]|uniref:cupin domain-containing protein n=1 Tax=Pantoea ananas TaxID=553 RepID=UPI0024AC84B0|nr:cupin domain-containing protein [Pantoea ananatis]MDI6539870.1 cupin domain-containing protein [Pantoea ananatis]
MKINKFILSRVKNVIFISLVMLSTVKFANAEAMPLIISTPSQITFSQKEGTSKGTPDMPGVSTKVLFGDPAKAGLTTVIVRISPHTRFQPLTHPNDGFVTVLSGRWYVGFGQTFDSSGLKALKPGDFYTEPGNAFHYAETRAEPAIVAVTTAEPGGLISK